jgi:BirA family transcriptional regulator, biotin operon repressor / biotin---[acetyl-CoA-carboxylase] ligase
MVKLFKNKRVFKLIETDSTNNFISELPDNTTEGSIVYAMKQSQGRGQGSNQWESEPNKNLTCSILLHPNFIKAFEQFYLLKVIAIAVADFISHFTDKVSIKWPNDIYVGDRKIAGILIENSIERDYIKKAIAGIGVNINQEQFSSWVPNPVSLFQLCQKEFNIEDCLTLISDCIEKRYAILYERDFETIDKAYLDLLYRLNQPSEYFAEGKKFIGTIIAVEPTGELVICDDHQKMHSFLFKEVEYVF